VRVERTAELRVQSGVDCRGTGSAVIVLSYLGFQFKPRRKHDHLHNNLQYLTRDAIAGALTNLVFLHDTICVYIYTYICVRVCVRTYTSYVGNNAERRILCTLLSLDKTRVPGDFFLLPAALCNPGEYERHLFVGFRFFNGNLRRSVLQSVFRTTGIYARRYALL